MLMSPSINEWRERDKDDSRSDKWVEAAVARNENDNYGAGELLVSSPLNIFFLINMT